MTITLFDDQPLPEQQTDAFYDCYELKETLGTGISSIVKKCVHKKTQKPYAVKILDVNSGWETPEVIRAECRREVTILQLVAGHPNIIELIQVYESEAYIFLVFELCSGGELFDHLTKVVTISEKHTRMIMLQLIDALQYIHSKGVIHRDLKPENILLDESMHNIKIVDFGLAVFSTDNEELCETRGTPGYLAPEVLKVGYYEDQPPYSFPVDMWACGVIMYTLLVGCPPFWNRKEHLMMRQIMECKYSFNSPEWEDVGDATKDLIVNLLVLEPSKRFTPTQALMHRFFFSRRRGTSEVPLFNAEHKFKSVCSSLLFIIRLQRLRRPITQFTSLQLTEEPYSSRRLRKLIDTVAFDVYSHWVKKGDDQNRAALFEVNPKRDMVLS